MYIVPYDPCQLPVVLQHMCSYSTRIFYQTVCSTDVTPAILLHDILSRDKIAICNCPLLVAAMTTQTWLLVTLMMIFLQVVLL